MINVETRLRRMNYSNGKCKVSNTCEINGIDENLSHLILTCRYNAKLWKMIGQVIRGSFGDQYLLGRFQKLCGVFEEDLQNDDLFIINMVMGMTRYHIYLMRNYTKHEGKQVSFEESYIKLRCYITEHIKILLLSKALKREMKEKLNVTLVHISAIFRNGLSEQDV